MSVVLLGVSLSFSVVDSKICLLHFHDLFVCYLHYYYNYNYYYYCYYYYYYYIAGNILFLLTTITQHEDPSGG